MHSRRNPRKFSIANSDVLFPFGDTKGRHHSRNDRRHFSRFAAKIDAALCDPAAGIEQRSRAVWSLFYKSHGTFLARSQETTSCRIRTGNGATVVNRIPNELIESLVAIAWLWNRRCVAAIAVGCKRKSAGFVGKSSSLSPPSWRHKSNDLRISFHSVRTILIVSVSSKDQLSSRS